MGSTGIFGHQVERGLGQPELGANDVERSAGHERDAVERLFLVRIIGLAGQQAADRDVAVRGHEHIIP
jgi:hypothetical protein